MKSFPAFDDGLAVRLIFRIRPNVFYYLLPELKLVFGSVALQIQEAKNIFSERDVY